MKTPTLPLHALAALLTVALPNFARGAEAASAPPAKSAAPTAAAQPADLKTPVPATPENASFFLGDWALNLEGPNGPATFALALKSNAGRMGGEISAESQPAQNISEFSRRGTALVMKYTFEYEAMHIEGVVTLTPGDSGLAASISFADGAFVMEGTATKKAK